MLDLISTTEDIHYENYRQQQMETRKFGEPRVKKSDNPKFKEEEEALRKRFTEQVKSEEARFRQWEQHVSCILIMHFSAHSCHPFPCSLLQNVIDSIRIWNTLTVPLRVLRLNWTTSKLATGGDPVDDRRPKAPLFFLVYPYHSLVCHSFPLEHIHCVCRSAMAVIKDTTRGEQT